MNLINARNNLFFQIFVYLFFLSYSLVAKENFIFKIAPLPGEINSEAQEFGPSLTADGKTLFFYSKRNSEHTDIYISYHINKKWIKPAKVRGINSQYDDQSPYISPDGSFMIFSSNRDGSTEFKLEDGRVGVSRDLYYTEFKRGVWSKPAALPNTINTKETEENPFIYKDDFYFTRYPFGKPSEAQIYHVRLKDDSFTAETPKALPYPINNPPYSTIAIVISADGKEIYFSSNRPGGYGGYDIYRSKVEPDGKFAEPENLGPEINSSGDEAYFILNDADKTILFCRKESGKSYDIYSAKRVEDDDFEEILKIKKKLTTNNINFDKNKSDIKPESLPELDKITNFLLKNPDVKIKVIGHTDLTGDFKFNETLSLERAESVKKHFISKGVSANSIVTEGKGSTQPLYNSKEEEFNKLNRRTEFQIIDLTLPKPDDLE